MKPIKLTPSETSHILSLIRANERDGSYYAPREQYWKRSGRIKAKLIGSYPDIVVEPAQPENACN